MDESKLKSKSRLDLNKLNATQKWDAWCESIRDTPFLNSYSRKYECNDDDCSVSSSSLGPGSEIPDSFKRNYHHRRVDPIEDINSLKSKSKFNISQNHVFDKTTFEEKVKTEDGYSLHSQTPDANKISSRKRRNCYSLQEEVQDSDPKLAFGKKATPFKDTNEHLKKEGMPTADEKLSSKFDMTSYLLGERSGFEKGVYQSKSDRETLSSLSSKLKDLRICMLSDKERLKYIESNGKSIENSLTFCVEKQNNLDQRLPKIEAELSEVKLKTEKNCNLAQNVSILSQKLTEIENFRCKNASLSAIQNKSFSNHARNFGYLIVSNLGQIDYLLSLFARKLILPNIQSINLSINSGEFKDGMEESNYFESRKQKMRKKLILKKDRVEKLTFENRIQNFLGVFVLIFSFEGVYFFQQKMKRKIPEKFKALTLPLHNGMLSIRFLLWASIFLIASQELKKFSFFVSTIFVRGIFRIPKLFQNPKSKMNGQDDSDSSNY